MSLKSIFDRGDGAHHGISDWYEEKEKALEAALASGADFDTGWYSSKKEIASGRIFRSGDVITCEASCSDDFDTEGSGQKTIPAEGATLDAIREALDAALDDAGADKTENEPYIGFSVHKRVKRYAVYCGGKPQGRPTYGQGWVETLIIPKDGDDTGTPPGDNYHQWGWQQECVIPRLIRAKLRAWAEKFIAGENCEESRTVDGYTIKPWDDA